LLTYCTGSSTQALLKVAVIRAVKSSIITPVVMMSVRTLSLLLPMVFALHVAEEAPFFVGWFNARVTPQITQGSFVAVNGVAFLVTVCVAALLSKSRGVPEGLFAAAWVGFLMLANGLFHLVANIADGSYCPGVLTGTFLYLPLSILFLKSVAREAQTSPFMVAAAAIAGGVPMGIHGYLIVFSGSRLF
jgi:hypothetical protein